MIRGALVLAGGSLIAVNVALWSYALTNGWAHVGLGVDLELYTSAARNWMATGNWYWPYQWEPYPVWYSDPLPILYPPVTLPLFLGFTVIPAPLWWAIPIGGTLAIAWHHRPPWQAWVLAVGLALYPGTFQVVWTGNPTMWIMFGVALATVRPAFGPLAFVKLTMAPFALVGIRHREWWIAAAVLGLITLPFAADYITILRNAEGHGGLLYSVNQWPLVLIPVALWLGGLVHQRQDDDVIGSPRPRRAVGYGQSRARDGDPTLVRIKSIGMGDVEGTGRGVEQDS